MAMTICQHGGQRDVSDSGKCRFHRGLMEKARKASTEPDANGFIEADL